MWESVIIIPILLMKRNYQLTLTKWLYYKTRIGIQSLFLICQLISKYQLATNSKTDIFHVNDTNILIEHLIFFLLPKILFFLITLPLYFLCCFALFYCSNVYIFNSSLVGVFFFKILFIDWWETHKERGKDIDRGRSRLFAESPVLDLIPEPWDHPMSWRQMLNPWAT